jgi:Ricin-type beta-trefoil lectin domain-like
MRRTRGSWTPRIIGIGAVVLVAVFGAIVYSVASPARAARHSAQLSTRVQFLQIVGLIGQVPAGPHAVPRMLDVSAADPAFGPMPPASMPQGDPQWTADTMVGGTYVFIYAPSGRCLSVTGPRPALTVQRCDLGAGQRWQRVNDTVQSGGHEYNQYRNLASGQCLTTGGALRGSALDAAGLAVCARRAPARQLVSFWWSA